MKLPLPENDDWITCISGNLISHVLSKSQLEIIKAAIAKIIKADFFTIYILYPNDYDYWVRSQKVNKKYLFNQKNTNFIK